MEAETLTIGATKQRGRRACWRRSAAEALREVRYNVKGQRERMGSATTPTIRYEYDDKTFRLTRLVTDS